MAEPLSTGFNVLTANLFKTVLSFDILNDDVVDGARTNVRIDKPDFSLGGLEFKLVTSAVTDADLPFAAFMELSKTSQDALMDGCEINVTSFEMAWMNEGGRSGRWELPPFALRTDESARLFTFKTTTHCDIEMEMQFRNFFPHRLQFVDEEVAKKNFNDCKIVLTDDEEKTVFVNKTVLAMRSPFFQKLFFSELKEKEEDAVKLVGVKQADFLEYLCCVYPPPNRPFIFKKLEALIVLAARFQNELLLSAIEKFLMERKNKSYKEMRKTLFLADTFNMSALFRTTLIAMDKSDLKKLNPANYAGFRKENLELLVTHILASFTHCKC